jgi:hypothetical protein
MTSTTVGAEVRRFTAQRVGNLWHNDRHLIAADRTVSLWFEYGAGSLNGGIRTDTAARVRVGVRQVPVRVTVNGDVTPAAYDAATGMVSLDVPAGSNMIAISWASDR